MNTPNSHRLSFIEKAGYSLGDAAANFVFMTMILFQQNFYTDTFGLPAAIAGIVLMVGRFWDAFFDPLMGIIADRTNTRWGKFRPWILWTALPWAVIMTLTFTVPNLCLTGKIIYAILTNMLLMTIYSANNTPYSALSGVMTGDSAERTRLSQYRFVAAMTAQLLVGGLTLPLVAKFGQGDSAKGWQTTMAIWALVCLFCFLITFLTTRERIQPDPKQSKSIIEDFRSLAKNGPWLAMFILTLAHFTMISLRGGVGIYYFKYYLDSQKLYEFLDWFGITKIGPGHPLGGIFGILGLTLNSDLSNLRDVAFSFQQVTAQFVTLIGVFSATWLSLRFGKRAVALAGFILTTVLICLFALIPREGVVAAYITEWLRALCYGPTIPLLWAMFADVADYGEWKTGRRITGVVFATIIFALKFGLSLGALILGLILKFHGYAPNVDQSPLSLLGIRSATSLYPAFFLLIVIACLYKYPITKQLNEQIQRELEERRKKYGGPDSNE